MSKPLLLLLGAGGHARACIDVIEQQGQYAIAGLVGMHGELNELHLGYRVIASDDDLPQLAAEYRYAFVSVGHIESPAARVRLYKIALDLGFQLPAVIAPSAHVSPHASLGKGTIVMHGAIVNASASVGCNCIINTRALIEHDAVISDHCHVSTGAIVNGNAKFGARSFLGSGSIVKNGIQVGSDCLVGMGLSVRRDLPDFARITSIQ